MVQKYKIVVSDLHLGEGRIQSDGAMNMLEDFVQDRQFAEFLEHYRSGKYLDAEVELILNGDILNGIQVDYRGYFSPILTESISVEKLKKIVKGHPIWFQALRDFAATPNHRIVYVVGNHDVEMIWNRCKEVFSDAVGHPVEFRNFQYVFDGIHVEHGNQLEIVNRLDPKKIFLTKGLKEPILNLPWGSHFIVNFIIPIKKERPVVDKVRPLQAFVRWGLIYDPWWLIKTMIRAVLYFIGTRFSRSIYRASNLVTTLQILKELTSGYDVTRPVKKILDDNPEIHTVICGHTHHAMHRVFENGTEYLNSGTWNEFVSLDLMNLGRGETCHYILIDYVVNPGRPRAYLREWRGRWHQDVEAS